MLTVAGTAGPPADCPGRTRSLWGGQAVCGVGDVQITVSPRGDGRPILLLHGGGPITVTPWADQLTTPGSVSLDALAKVGAPAYEDKILIDVANAVTPAFALMYPGDSLAERIQQALPQAKVVKTMNTAAITVLTQPNSLAHGSVFVSGDHDEAKAVVTGLLRDLGWPDEAITDLGGISSARGVEHYFLLFVALMRTVGRTFNIHVVTGGRTTRTPASPPLVPRS